MTPMARTLEAGGFPADANMVDPIINVLLFFDSLPPASAWAREFETHLYPAFRFNSRMDNGYWVQAQGYDAAYHFPEVAVRDEAAIDAYVQGSFLEGLDKTRPPWKVVLLSAPAPSRSAAWFRMHHSIGDGLGLLFAMSPMFGCEGGDMLSKVPLPPALLPPWARQAETAAAAPKPKPRRGCGEGIRKFGRGLGVALLAKPDSELSINPPLSERTPYIKFNGNRALARFPPVEMSLVHQARKKHGCSVNDVLMAALTGALRRFGAEVNGDERLKGDAGETLECKALMLIGLPRPIDPSDMAGSISNRHLYASLPLPVHESDPAGRVKEIMRSTDALKSRPYISGLSCFIDGVNLVAPKFLLRKAVGETFSKHSLIVTSVPAPTAPMTFPRDGDEAQVIREVQMVFPNMTSQVSIITYGGFVHANIVADPALFPRPQELGRLWAEEFAALLAGP